MTEYYLAVDIGASSGRHMLFHLENGMLKMEEIYRFENRMMEEDGHLYWDIERLFSEIIKGMQICSEKRISPVSMAIDTWAVDYVLLDKNDNLLRRVYAYRDKRTESVVSAVSEFITPAELYKRTGIQHQSFNTVYQLMDDVINSPELIDRARTFLMLPDYFSFLLTGQKASEYTNATSTQLVLAEEKNWNFQLMKEMGIPTEIFHPIVSPGNNLGKLKSDIALKVGFECDVIQCASHDTASAVMAVPSNDDGIYISSGTWSLMGVENTEALIEYEDYIHNFTNEGGYDYRFRYLKNIMGLWMIQCVRHEMQDRYSFSVLADMAAECTTIDSVVDVNDARFLAPENMIQAICDYCEETQQKVPQNAAELAKVIYVSLANSYKKTCEAIEANTNKAFTSINIVGGGCKNRYLNRLTADMTGKTVYAGPSEATAIGNVVAQMIERGRLDSLASARECIRRSFEIEKYFPE